MNRFNMTAKIHHIYKQIQKELSPTQIILISFVLLILLGTFLLYLPFSHLPGVEVSLLNTIFTATSAVCVTGLTTLTTVSTWSFFGKIIILCLIQIGGLSLVTVFFFFLVQLGKKVTFKDRLTIQAALNNLNPKGMVRMVLLVIRGTLICEGIGAVLLTLFFLLHNYNWNQSLFYGIFHSVSAFCNAGFDLIGDQSLIPFSSNITFNLIIIILIIIGGIGFTVWSDIIQKVKFLLSSNKKKRVTFSLHSKLALLTTLILLVSGTAYFMIFEYNNPSTLGNLTWPHKFLTAFFQSTTLRTAGFSTISQGGLNESSKLISSIFMLIGGSPGGTAGGIKTVTIAILFCSVWSVIKDYYNITVFGRSLSTKTLQKALAILVIMFLIWIGATTLLSLTESNSIFNHTFIDLLFETSSALGTVGLTTGITPFLSSFGKLIIIFCMFIGRIGPIAIVISLSNRSSHINALIRYPEEDIMIG
ncbi:MAG: potassium transporter TrkG [Mobilitalea sp.]